MVNLDDPEARNIAERIDPARLVGFGFDSPGATLSARGLDTIVRDLRAAEVAMGAEAGERQERAMRRYTRLDAEFTAAGGYAAESEAASIAGALGLDERVPTLAFNGYAAEVAHLYKGLEASEGDRLYR